MTSDATLAVTGVARKQEKVSNVEDGSGPKGTTLTTFESVGLTDQKPRTVLVRSNDGFPTGEVATYEVGSTYVLFLEPFEFVPGKSTGSYAAVGQLAAYAVQADGQSLSDTAVAERITSRDKAPKRLSVGDLRKAAASISTR